MRNLFKTGIAGTFLVGFILLKFFPVSNRIFLENEAEKQMLIQGIFVVSTLTYLCYTLWKYMSQRTWIRIILIFSILFSALIFGYLLTGFVIQPILISNAWSFHLLSNNQSNIVWYWPFGITLITYLLHVLVKVCTKIVRGETFVF